LRNANLCSIIPNLELKLGMKCLADDGLKHLTRASRYINEVANLFQTNVPHLWAQRLRA
jgi:2-isopropylmalate synthase